MHYNSFSVILAVQWNHKTQQVGLCTKEQTLSGDFAKAWQCETTPHSHTNNVLEAVNLYEAENVNLPIYRTVPVVLFISINWLQTTHKQTSISSHLCA